jgi:hypothetical protein
MFSESKYSNDAEKRKLNKDVLKRIDIKFLLKNSVSCSKQDSKLENEHNNTEQQEETSHNL